MNLVRLLLFSALVLFAFVGCVKKEIPPDTAGHDHAPQLHEHKAPHGGTSVVLGKEAYHLELVLDRTAGKLSAYVFDGEMDNYIRVASPSFDVTATVDGTQRSLVFQAIADSATGEKIGDTALFEATAEWLKTVTSFDAVLAKIEIRGSAFSDVSFNFPKGNDKD